ncbi:protein-tyrosine phosphatase [Rhizoctonia solani]|uniref:Protein-tyrosine phosphatase n=1 Tax=Rhizoctonia solani TaxID=456999 RepID=A0A0K6G8U9_9AGAM|nr:protein-tyrosine phosphatase [Rhizoctonia solani]
MGHSGSRLSFSSRRNQSALPSTPKLRTDSRKQRKTSLPAAMSSPSSSRSKSNKVPAYIWDTLRDPDLLLENWSVLADLDYQRQHAMRESLVRTYHAKPPEVARYSVALAGQNTNRNRYQNVAPYDLNAVRVGEEAFGPGQGMYLNASWVRERAGGALWIASQAPLPNSHFEFLALCTDLTPKDKRVRTIVQLTPWVEKKFQAAHPYFPNELGESIVISRTPQSPNEPLGSKSRLRVTVAGKRFIAEADCFIRSLEITYEGSSQEQSPVFEVRHLAFDSWADHGVPNSPSTAYQLALLADRCNRMPHTPESGQPVDPAPPPILVHCSAGVGRTGTFIAMSSLLRSFGILPPAARPSWDTYTPESSAVTPQGKQLPEDDQVVQEVNALREQRTLMVQMPDQMEFIYGILAAALSGKFEGSPPEFA